jgi:hypothetical protein
MWKKRVAQQQAWFSLQAVLCSGIEDVPEKRFSYAIPPSDLPQD